MRVRVVATTAPLVIVTREVCITAVNISVQVRYTLIYTMMLIQWMNRTKIMILYIITE